MEASGKEKGIGRYGPVARDVQLESHRIDRLAVSSLDGLI
jgi:hypothetical protein